MKTRKRDRFVRAHKKGYQAGLNGKSKESGPTQNGPDKQEWLAGWREGRQDNWDGLTGVSSVSKIEHVMR